jgi:tRNA/tmRNA/rRNA uracil-C5-methylase (TrmA/RlmC/RlmD family)
MLPSPSTEVRTRNRMIPTIRKDADAIYGLTINRTGDRRVTRRKICDIPTVPTATSKAIGEVRELVRHNSTPENTTSAILIAMKRTPDGLLKNSEGNKLTLTMPNPDRIATAATGAREFRL